LQIFNRLLTLLPPPPPANVEWLFCQRVANTTEKFVRVLPVASCHLPASGTVGTGFQITCRNFCKRTALISMQRGNPLNLPLLKLLLIIVLLNPRIPFVAHFSLMSLAL
jgi:hypothetical protein